MIDRDAPLIVDLGMGNLRSVERAVGHAAAARGLPAPFITADPDAIARAERIVVPGQGAFRDGAAALAANDGALGSAITEAIERGARFFGICLGLQLLFESSDEAPGARGLAVFEGRVSRIADGVVDPLDPTGRRTLKVPHMGWNQPSRTSTRAGARFAPLLAAAPSGWFYFVHSYHAVPNDPALVAAVAPYGPLELTAAIAHENLVATQFHPEKSQADGLALLAAALG
jgi:glutamine amidotransferase